MQDLVQLRNCYDRFRRTPVWAKLLIGVLALFVFVLGYAAYDGRRIRGQVALERVDRPDDVRELAAFLTRLQQIQNWQPSGAELDKLTLVARFANLPSNVNRDEYSDLLRTTLGNEPNLNASLELLSRPETNKLLKKLRQDNSQAFALAMQRALAPTIEGDRDVALDFVLGQEKSQKLMRRLEIMGPAGEPGRFGKLWRSTVGQSQSNRADWVNELLDQGQHIKRLADWYTRLERTLELPLNANDQGAGLWFVRDLVSGIEYDGLNSTLNGELQVRVPGAESAKSSMRLINTGVELNGLKIEPPPPGPVTNAELRIQRLPSPTIAPEQLNRALTQLGLPGGFSLSNIKCAEENRQYTVSFTATSRVLQDCRFDWRWQLNGNTLSEVKKGLEGLPKTARASFDQALTKTTKFWDWNVRFEPGKADFWKAKVQLGNEELSFSVHVDEQCRLHWHGLPDARDATVLLDYLLMREDRLRKLAPLASLDQVHFTEANLFGELRLRSPSPGQPVHTGINWTISPNGAVQMNLSPATLAYLEVSQEHLPASSIAQPFSVEQARLSVAASLKANYGKLASSVKVDDVRLMNGLPWARLSLTIADWPALDLGSYLVASHSDSRAALEKALSQTTVGPEVGRRWSQQHPSLGRVKVDFKAFDPQEAMMSITVRTVMALTDKQLNWPERLSIASGVWTSDMSEELINRYLEPQIDALEKSINGTLKEVARTTFELKLKVNRDAFGRGRWLKLSPLSIMLDGRLELGVIPLGAEVVGVKIDGDGFYWPQEIASSLRLTIPAGAIAISDPSLRVILPQDAANRLVKGEFGALGDMTYMLGGKFTPPSYGGIEFAAGLDRLDNPWLRLIYLQAELGGRLNNPKVAARGKLVAIEEYDLATASFESSLTKLDLHARLRTLDARDSWLPRFDGELTMTKEVPVHADAEMSLAGIALKGWLVYTTDSPARIEGEMYGNLPGLGQLKFEAKSDAEFKDPELIGYMPVPFVDDWSLKATVKRSGITLELVKITPAGKLVVRMDFPDASAIDVAKLKARLAEMEQLAKPASAEEVEWLKMPDAQNVLEPLPKSPGRETAQPAPLKVFDPESAPSADAAATAKKRPEPLPIPEAVLGREVKDDYFRIFTRKDNKTIVKLKSSDAGITNHDETHILIAWYKDSTRIDLLLTDFDRKRVQHVRCSDSTTVESVTDWTDRLESLNLFPTGEQTAAEQLQGLAKRKVLYRYADQVWSEAEPSTPKAQDGGYSIRCTSPLSKTLTDEFFTWVGGGRVCNIRFQGNYIPEREVTSDLRRLVVRAQEPGDLVLIAAEPRNERLAVIQFQQGKTRLIPDLLKDPTHAIDLKLTQKIDENGNVTLDPGSPRLGQVGRRLVLPSWQTGQPLPTGACYIAGEGGCLVAEKQFWLMPSNECTDQGLTTPVTRIDRDTFDKWNSDTKRHLPRSWQDDAARALVPSEQIAAQAVASWGKQRRDEKWGAIPMGLLIRLATSGGGPAAPR